MRGCAAAIARAIVDFLDAVLRCFLSWFRSSPISARRHLGPLARRDRLRLGEVLSDEEKGSPSLPLVHSNWLGEVLSDEEKGFGGSRGLHRHRKHGRDIDEELSGESNTPRKLNRGNLFDVEDENCIPNTTSKYREDQMVSWHATPFEERLLRILSDGPNPPRRLKRGAGIPNTGSKYKQDHKVRMHTEPFEERLSRCLSDEPNTQGNLQEETCSM